MPGGSRPWLGSVRASSIRQARPIKAGPAGGVFLEITRKAEPDLAIPGNRASFGTVQLAQALGDLDVLAERRRGWLRIHIEGDVDDGLAAIGRLIAASLT